MEHQPVTPPVNEMSTEQFTDGATISDQGVKTAPQGFLINQGMTFDSMQPFPFYERRFDITRTSDWLFWCDPGSMLLSHRRCFPIQMIPIQSCYYYDLDIIKTFVAIKHERVRGRIEFKYLPGVYTTDTFTLGSTGLPSHIESRDKRAQRWIWDLEKEDTFSIMLKGSKVAALRSRVNPPVVNPNSATGMTRYDIRGDSIPTWNFGTLTARMHQPYQTGNVAPEIMTIVILNTIVNPTYAEYKTPLASSMDKKFYPDDI
jgi:hypothetical protein